VSTLRVDIVSSNVAMAQGLMHRKELPQDEGMLFKFHNSIEPSFWGKNTYIPLDIAFVNSANQIVDIKKIVPMSTRQVHGNGLSSMAIEANAGFFAKNNIGIGSKVNIQCDEEGKTAEVRFG